MIDAVHEDDAVTNVRAVVVLGLAADNAEVLLADRSIILIGEPSAQSLYKGRKVQLTRVGSSKSSNEERKGS